MARQDPLRGFRFLLEIEGISSGGFMRVKGLSREVRHESYREGGVNDYEHKLVTQVTYPAVVLERGLALDDLWRWALDAADGQVVVLAHRTSAEDRRSDRRARASLIVVLHFKQPTRVKR